MASLETVAFSLESYSHDLSLPSQDLPASVTYPQISPIIRISKMEVHNFKSFVGPHVIGEYLSNTAIVGPNGSGKSNIIDAICFVFGISVSSLRSSNLKDLVNKNLADGQGGNNKKGGKPGQDILASVSLELELENNEVLEFRRTIDTSFKSRVYINGDEFHWLHFSRFLHMCHINTNPASFLIMQSETYSMIEKTPKQLIEYFEKLCGSFELKEKYLELKASYDEVIEQIKEKTIALNSIKADRKKLRQQIHFSEEYKKLVEDLDTLENQIYGLNFLKFDLVLSRKSKDFKEKSKLMDDQRKSQEKDRLERQKKAQLYRKKRDELKKLEERQAKKKKELAENRIELSKTSEESNYSVRLLNGKEVSLKKMEEEFDLMKNNLEKLSGQEMEIANDLQKCEKELEVDENQQETGKLKKNFNEYLQFQKEAEVKLQPLKLEIQKIRGHEKKVVEKLEEIRKKQENAQNAISSTNKKLKDIGGLIANNQENYSDFSTIQTDLTTNYDNLNKQIHNTSQKREKLMQLKGKKEALLADAQYLINSMHDLKEKNDLFYELRTIKGFREDLSTLVSPLRPEFELPLRIALGPAMDYLVVDNMEVAKAINAILREKGMQKDVLILENIPKAKRELNGNLIGNFGLLAENTLTFRREIQNLDKAISFLLQGKIICETAKLAETVKNNFKKKKAVMPKEIITHEGLVLREGFITTYGNIERMKEGGKKFTKMLDQKSMELKIAKEQEIEKIKMELKKNEEDMKEVNTNQEERELRKLEVKIQENKARLILLESEAKGLKETKKTVEQQLKAQEDALKKLNVEKAKLEKELGGLREEMKEHEKTLNKEQTQIYKPLLQKLKINDISEIKGKDYEELDKIYEKKLALTKSLEAIRLELKNNKAAILEANIKTLKASITKEIQINETLQKNFKNFENNAVELSKELDALKNDIANVQSIINEEESEESKNLTMLQNLDNEFTQKERELREIEVALHQNLNKKQQLYEELKIKSVSMKLMDEPSKYEFEFSQIEPKLFPSSGRSQRRAPKIHIDYDALNIGKLLKKLISDMDTEEEKEIDIKDLFQRLELDSIEQKLDEMENEMKVKGEKVEEYTSNMMQNSLSSVFSEKLEKYDTKITEINKEQDILIGKEKKIKEEFDSNKKVRVEKFIGFFEDVKKLTDEIYKNLTKTDKNYDVGGSALLYLENEDDPFSAGIIYSPTPPNKRYVYDSEQLSGGEKTMGGLALLFALNIAAKTKFMIFDETDAYLDFENSQKFMEFVKEISEKAGMQIILVSHKKNFYENAQSLIGVTYSNKGGTSQTFSLDLRKKD